MMENAKDHMAYNYLLLYHFFQYFPAGYNK